MGPGRLDDGSDGTTNELTSQDFYEADQHTVHSLDEVKNGIIDLNVDDARSESGRKKSVVILPPEQEALNPRPGVRSRRNDEYDVDFR